MDNASVLETILERDRTIVVLGLVSVIILSWIYILLRVGMGRTAFEMTTMSMPGDFSGVDKAGHDNGMTSQTSMGDAMRMAHAAMMQPAVWTFSYAAMIFLMWWIMVVAMMLPSAAPMILLFACIQRKERDKGAPFIPTSVFTAG